MEYLAWVIPNAMRVYRIADGVVFPDRLEGGCEGVCIGAIADWNAKLPGLIGEERRDIEKSLVLPPKVKGDRWDSCRARALIKIFLDHQSWESAERRFDRQRFLEAVNAHLLLGVESVEEALLIDNSTLTSAAGDIGFRDLHDLHEAIAGRTVRVSLRDCARAHQRLAGA